MRIAYVTIFDSKDIHVWSGLTVNISKALSANKDVELYYIDNLLKKNKGVLYYFLGFKKRLWQKLGKKFDAVRSPKMLQKFARTIQKELKADTDFIFSDSTLPPAYLKVRTPIIIYSDSTFASMLGFYTPVSDRSKETLRNGHIIEKRAMESYTRLIFSSDWAARSAAESYGISPDKISVVPFGANIESPKTYDEIAQIIDSRSKTTCKLLFLGVDWTRKGGPMALRIVRELKKSGLQTELHIAGPHVLPIDDLPSNVINHGFISKANPEGRNKIEQLIKDSHFLVLPTRAEAYGLVLCEANSLGVPAITNDVGGTTSIIRNDINGFAFPPDSPAEDYANYITQVFRDPERYRSMCRNSYNEYNQRLNWGVAGKSIIQLLNDIK